MPEEGIVQGLTGPGEILTGFVPSIDFKNLVKNLNPDRVEVS
jgi:hypothetical protein